MQHVSPPARQHRGGEVMPSNKHRAVNTRKKKEGVIARDNEPKQGHVNVAELLRQFVTRCVPSSRPHISTRATRRGARRNVPPTLVAHQHRRANTPHGVQLAQRRRNQVQRTTNGHPLYVPIENGPISELSANQLQKLLPSVRVLVCLC